MFSGQLGRSTPLLWSQLLYCRFSAETTDVLSLVASEQSSFRELVTVGLDFFFFNHDLQNLNLQLLVGSFVIYIVCLVGKNEMNAKCMLALGHCFLKAGYKKTT